MLSLSAARTLSRQSSRLTVVRNLSSTSAIWSHHHHSHLPTKVHSEIPVIRDLDLLRKWRRDARDRHLEVGVVPTMGALHDGHLSLVRQSLKNHPLTVMTLFVNPMQFAPTEDLNAYPRTLDSDLEKLGDLLSRTVGPRSHPTDPTPLVVFAPTVDTMYPLRGELQDMSKHRGATVNLSGWGDVMEGASRPQFFTGVATVCTKLFNAVEPDHAYFGQKDIQQALLLKIMLNDLLVSHPTPDNLHILPTTRNPASGLALSSRNAYLSEAEMKVAPTLAGALRASRTAWAMGMTGDAIVEAGRRFVAKAIEKEAKRGNVHMQLDYIELFDKRTFAPVRGDVHEDEELVVAGAMWVGKTRLIDNLLLGWEADPLVD